MKRKRTNLKRYIRDRWMNYVEQKFKRDCIKFVNSMSKPHVSISYTINSVPIENYGLIIDVTKEIENASKLAVPINFNPFEKDISEILKSYFGTAVITDADKIYKIKSDVI